MKVFSAKYDPSYNTADNSLVNNMLKYPEIAKKIIELYPRYSMTYLLERLGFGASEKVIGANAFEWKVMKRYKEKAVLETAVSANKAAGATTTLSIRSTEADSEFCMLQANDIIRFERGGATAMVTSVGTIDTAGNTDVVVRHITAYDFSSTNAAAGSVVGVIGSAFGQGSLGDEVGEGYAYPETHRNHLTLSRRKMKINGIDLHDVTWVEHNGHRLWYFTKEQQMTDQFMYELELNRWFGKSSVAGDTSTNAITFPGDAGSVAAALGSTPVMGDGIIAQIDSGNIFDYTPHTSNGVGESVLLDALATLSLNSIRATGNEYVVFTGMTGMVNFQKGMKAFLSNGVGASGSAGPIFVDKAGQDIEVGGNFTTYHALGNKLTLVHNPCFDDPNMATLTGGVGGFNSANELSGAMVFMDMSVQDGVANVELIAKGAEGYNRNYVKKYVPGMINPNDPSSMMAANGNDTFECHILSESGVIVRNPLSCGIVKPSGITL